MRGSFSLDIQALIFASETPLSLEDIFLLMRERDNNISKQNVTDAIKEVEKMFAQHQFTFQLKEIGGGYQFLTKPDFFDLLILINKDKFSKKLSTSSMETLSIIAYKQPATKTDIEMIRGVNCDYAVQKLLDKELIYISGRENELPGKPLLYSTTTKLLDYLGLNHIRELPKLSEVKPEMAEVMQKIQVKLDEKAKKN